MSAPPPVIALGSLYKDYGSVQALRGLDLTVRSGQVYGFLGRNGAGKSTALRIIMGITQPSSGQVQLFGQPLLGEAPAVRQRIGYVAQEQSFYGWMTPERLGQFVRGFYPSWEDAEFSRLLKLLEVPAQRRIETFSGGTHAKLALAVALAHRPELLVLDEPTAGMDAVARREFLELVHAQAHQSGRTTLFSSHLIDEVELAADTVGIIDGGRMLWQGPRIALQRQVRRLRHQAVTGSTPPLPEIMFHPDAALTVLDDRTDDQGRTVMVSGVPVALEALEAKPDGWLVEIPSLEDVFVALVRKPVAY